jgi:hypothetical protein
MSFMINLSIGNYHRLLVCVIETRFELTIKLLVDAKDNNCTEQSIVARRIGYIQTRYEELYRLFVS